MEFKDLFSQRADLYARFRPSYPDSLFSYLASLTNDHNLALDCGTGNGQAAMSLVPYFQRILAIDPSEKQLLLSRSDSKIVYQCAPAEEMPVENQSVDLIVVAQAFHWFKPTVFFEEVRRVLKPGGVIAIWCYDVCQVNPEIDAILVQFYSALLKDYWEKESAIVDDAYRSSPFPFVEMLPPQFEMKADWNIADLLGYLETWSAVQNYIAKNLSSPIDKISQQIQQAWGEDEKISVRWDISLRVGCLQ
jgi:SAM-dependent methyltransferase